MLKENVYIESAEYFQTSVGVAHQIGSKSVTEFKDESDVKKYNDEYTINKIICNCIRNKEYQLLQRTLYRLRKENGKRNIKEVTIYKKAWYFILNGHDKKRNNTKSGKILEESR